MGTSDGRAGHASEAGEPRHPWVEALGLKAHPEGGYFAETWRSGVVLPQVALPDGYDGPRDLATGILFLLLPGQSSAWHLVTSDELWLHQRGGPLVLALGGQDAAGPRAPEEITLGTEDLSSQRPQVLVPAGTRPRRARPRRVRGCSRFRLPRLPDAGSTIADRWGARRRRWPSGRWRRARLADPVTLAAGAPGG